MQRRRRRTVVAGVAAGVVVAAVVAVAAFGPSRRAGAQEDYPVPGGGVFTLAGHGFGHGHGLSQYGARGAALSGLTAAQILGFYYPGTAVSTVSATSPIRVRLVAANPSAVPVQGVAGLAVRNAATNVSYPVADPTRRYRVIADAAGMHVQSSPDGVTWTTLTLGGLSTFAGPMVFQGPPLIRLYYPSGDSRDYEGTLTAVRASATTLTTVNTLGLDQYVNGVLPREMPASWPGVALQAQAVAARTYGVSSRSSAPPGQAWDICDSTACQVYGGRRLYSGGQVIDLQPLSSRNAVAATAGQIRSYNGAPIFAQFSSSNGGWTSANPAFPYLVARADPYDAISNPYANWTLTLSTAELSACFPAAGTVYRLSVLTRDGHGQWGGRILTARLYGRSAGGALVQQDITGNQLRACKSSAGFRSTYATITSAFTSSAAPAGIREPNGNIDLFARGPRGETMFRRYLAGQGWQAWQSLGGGIVGGPTVSRRPTGSLNVWARGINNQLYLAGVRDGQWLGYSSKGGALTSRPYPVVLSDGSVDVFFRGTDGAMWYGRWSTGGTFLGWHSLGGQFLAVGPAGATTGSGALRVVGVGTNHAVYVRSLQAGVWGPWRSIGSATTSDVAAASPSPGVLDVYTRGDSTGSLVTRRLVGGTWGAWQDAGGGLAAGPWAAIVPGTTRTEVWVQGSNGYMYLRSRSSNGAWGPYLRLS